MRKENKQYYKKIPYNGGLLVHCPKCETDGEPSYRLGGKKWINIILFVLGIIPGILYLIRRCMNTVCLCKNCNNEELGEINNDTKLIEELKKINLKQNLYYILLVLFLVLVVFDIIIRIQS